MLRLKNIRGFTIVELLIVIVVIGILAAITIVAFNGVQNRSRTAVAQADVTNAQKQISLAKEATGTSAYPTSVSDCPTPTSGAICLQTSNGILAEYFVDNTVSPASYCYSSKIGTGDSYYIDETGKASKGSCASSSCFDIQKTSGPKESGVYWIKVDGAGMRVYCDMQTSGGGWTLLVTNPGAGPQWDTTTVKNLNRTQPSLSTSYSILDKANSLKTNINGMLRYRIEADGLGRWGGVWEAPYGTSFVGTSPSNNSVNVEQYDTWAIDTNPSDGTSTLSNNIPWLGPAPQLLTTWGNSGNWYGTLVTSQAQWGAAPYINTQHANAGVVRYWVR